MATSVSTSHNVRLARQLALAVPSLLLGGALVSQYGFGLFPCEMCMWQRYPHFAAIGLGLLASIAPPQKLWTALAAVAILISGAIGLFHAGVEQHWWEGITGCALTISHDGGDALEAILNAPIVRCDEIPWSFLGVSLAGWNFLVSTASGLGILWLLIRDVRAKGKE